MFKLGIERMDEFKDVFSSKRLGLLTTISAVDKELYSSASLLHAKYPLHALFAPEHGVNGAADPGAKLDEIVRDPQTNVNVFSLYRKDSQHFTADMLSQVDAVVYDIQDLGLRFYTYVSTLLNTLEDCARYDKECIVLDRPAPLGGEIIEGGLLRPSFESFVGSYPMPIRYGMTAGEFAIMANTQKQIGCKLTVIPMSGWDRRNMFTKLGYPFVMPSPSIPRFDNALLYAGTCLFEGTNISEGRGTADPFALLGAPYIDALRLCDAVRDLKIPGLAVSPAYYTPTASKHMGVCVQGIHLYVTDANIYPAVEAGLKIMDTVRTLYPYNFAFNPPSKEGKLPMIDLLSGSDMIRQGRSVKEILSMWRQESDTFKATRARFLLY